MYFKFIGYALFLVCFIGGCSLAPKPMTSKEYKEQIDEDLETIADIQNSMPVPDSMTLYQAMARAVKLNLEARTKQMEAALASNEIAEAGLGMVPRMVSSAGYANRDKPGASASSSLDNGKFIDAYNFSEQLNVNTYDSSYTFDLLDFATNYYRFKQKGNQYLISYEEQRRALQNLLMQVRTTFWRVATFERYREEAYRLLDESNMLMRRADVLHKTRLVNPLTSLNYRQEMLDAIKNIETVIKEGEDAKIQLAGLLNLPPHQKYTLDTAENIALKPDKVIFNLDRLVETALYERPDLIQENYKGRIALDEAKQALFEHFPGLNLNWTKKHTSNIYQFYRSWEEAGYTLSMNFIKMLTTPLSVRDIKDTEKLNRLKRMSQQMAIIIQVAIAKNKLESAQNDYCMLDRLDKTSLESARHQRVAVMAGTLHKMELAKWELREFLARTRSLAGYAQIQEALANLYSAIGIDPFREKNTDYDPTTEELPVDLGPESLNTIAEKIELNFRSMDEKLVAAT